MAYKDTMIGQLKIADFITLLNVFISTLSIYFIFNGLIEYSFGLIFVSVFLDYLDGFVARKMKQQNEFGAKLDSFADIIAFGLIPALLILQAFSDKGIIALIGSGILVISNVLRETRIQKNLGTASEYKIGVANTVIALVVASFYFSKIYVHPYIWDILFFVFSYLLITNIKYATHRKFGKALYYIAGILAVLSLASYVLYTPIPVFILTLLICIFYIIFGPLLRRRLE